MSDTTPKPTSAAKDTKVTKEDKLIYVGVILKEKVNFYLLTLNLETKPLTLPRLQRLILSKQLQYFEKAERVVDVQIKRELNEGNKISPQNNEETQVT